MCSGEVWGRACQVTSWQVSAAVICCSGRFKVEASHHHSHFSLLRVQYVLRMYIYSLFYMYTQPCLPGPCSDDAFNSSLRSASVSSSSARRDFSCTVIRRNLSVSPPGSKHARHDRQSHRSIARRRCHSVQGAPCVTPVRPHVHPSAQ